MAKKKMAATKKTVLITGCSDGGLGAALAVAFHKAGLHVIATARNTSKMASLVELGIETLQLDTLDDASIAACVSKVSSLDILVNNAGAMYSMPFSDISITEAKKLFDLNVWSYLVVGQAFLPLLLKSKGILVNHTSSASVLTIPFQSTYNASKSAMAVFSDSQRLELEPFGVQVVDIKSGSVISNISKNHKEATAVTLPKGSIYDPVREKVEEALGGEKLFEGAIPAEQWAELVTQNLLKKKPPPVIWMGGLQMRMLRICTSLPAGTLDGTVKKMVGLDTMGQIEAP